MTEKNLDNKEIRSFSEYLSIYPDGGMVDLRAKRVTPLRCTGTVATKQLSKNKINTQFFTACPDGGMVDTEVSKSSALRLAGSSPALGTKIISIHSLGLESERFMRSDQSHFESSESRVRRKALKSRVFRIKIRSKSILKIILNLW